MLWYVMIPSVSTTVTTSELCWTKRGEALPAGRELDGPFSDPVFQVLGEVAVLPQGEDLPDDQQKP